MDVERLARMFVTGSFIGLSIAWVIWSLGGLSLSDSDAYRQAARNLLAGEDLYVLTETQDEAYRYAPWFAFAWVPLIALPEAIGDVVWAGLLLLGTIGAVLPLARRPELAARLLALFGGSMLIWTSARGNVHPLVIVALIHGVDRRSGPLWVALAASLKAVPILFTFVYVAQRQWLRAFTALLLTAILVAPMPLLGWEPATTDPGESLSLWYLASPFVFVVGAGAALLLAALVAWRAPRWSALSAGVAAIMALPRLLLYDLTYLLVGADRSVSGSTAAPSRSDP